MLPIEKNPYSLAEIDYSTYYKNLPEFLSAIEVSLQIHTDEIGRRILTLSDFYEFLYSSPIILKGKKPTHEEVQINDYVSFLKRTMQHHSVLCDGRGCLGYDVDEVIRATELYKKMKGSGND